MRHSVAEARVEALTEETLAALGEQRIVLGRLERGQKNLEALEEALRIQHERLVAHVGHCRENLRNAEADLRSCEEIVAQVDGLLVEQMQIVVDGEKELDEGAGIVSLAAKDAGFAYPREELIAKGASALIARRRVETAGASPAEAEVV